MFVVCVQSPNQHILVYGCSNFRIVIKSTIQLRLIHDYFYQFLNMNSTNEKIKKPYLSLNYKLLTLGGIKHPNTNKFIVKKCFQVYTIITVVTVFFSYTVAEIIGNSPIYFYCCKKLAAVLY